MDKGNISRTLDYMENLFEHYDKAWIQGDINVRQRIQRAIFPKGLTYENPSFRTPELALPFSIIGESSGSKTTMVSPAGFEPTTHSLKGCRSTVELRAHESIMISN